MIVTSIFGVLLVRPESNKINLNFEIIKPNCIVNFIYGRQSRVFCSGPVWNYPSWDSYVYPIRTHWKIPMQVVMGTYPGPTWDPMGLACLEPYGIIPHGIIPPGTSMELS